MLGIVVSNADEASVHIGQQLLEAADWTVREDDSRPAADGGGVYHVGGGIELRTFEALHLDLENPAEPFDDPDWLVFASRHAGETGALLTAHFTGNFGTAEFGGADRELARACPNAHARVLASLREYAPTGYDVGMECTHHGPSSVGAPSMFVEIGSDEPQWRDPAAAEAVARAIIDLQDVEPDRDRTVVGFGGGHYAPRFERIVRETGWAVGHIAADWALESMDPLDRTVIEQSFEQSRASRAVVDGEWPTLVDLIADLGYVVVSETWLRETDDVPLDRVAWAESALCSVDDGLRFGAARGEASVQELDPSLLADANGIDRAQTRELVARHALAFETTDGGTRVDGRLALPDGARESLLDALIELLQERFEHIERRADGIVATEWVFDPERAAELGVEAGPDFGRLAAGEAVVVDGQRVTPEQVHVERQRTYSR